MAQQIDADRKLFDAAEEKAAKARELAQRKAIKRAASGIGSLQHRAELLIAAGMDFETFRYADFKTTKRPTSRDACMRLVRGSQAFVEKISEGGSRRSDGLFWWLVELGFADQPERDVSIAFYALPVEILMEQEALGKTAHKPIASRKKSGRRTRGL